MAVSSIAFLLVESPDLLWLAASLTVISNICFGVGIVFYNAYLPLLAEADPRVRTFKEDLRLKKNQFESDDQAKEALREVQDIAANELSTYGVMIGYVGGVLSLFIFCF